MTQEDKAAADRRADERAFFARIKILLQQIQDARPSDAKPHEEGRDDDGD